MSEVNILNLTKESVNQKNLTLLALATMKYLGLKGELSLVLAADTRLRSLNRDYRQHDKSTDVLTFPAPKTAPHFLGEIFINLKDCARPNKYQEVFDFKPSRDYLLNFLLVHGLLHLAGYSDIQEKDRLEMISLGQEIMMKLIKDRKIKLKG